MIAEKYIECVFFAEFDLQEGPQLVYQYPEK